MEDQKKSRVEHDWQSHIEHWKQSGLSQSEYSRQAGISNKRFYYHAHRLKKAHEKAELSFIKASAVIQSTSEPPTRIRVILPNGVHAVFEELGFDALSQVLNIASQLSCSN